MITPYTVYSAKHMETTGCSMASFDISSYWCHNYAFGEIKG